MSLLIKNIKSIHVCGDHHTQPSRGAQMLDHGIMSQAFIACRDGKIEDYGPQEYGPAESGFETVIDGAGCYVLPSWVDSHTHIVYHQSREEEFVYRIKGMSYEEIAESGGGILNSAKRLAHASEDELYDQAWARLMEVIKFGTGAIEIKSGYGLSVESELKILRVIQRLKETSPIKIKATFLGAHAVPTIYKSNRQEYIDLITEEMLPIIVREKLADYIDVFCDVGFFTVDETRHILSKGAEHGLRGKIHANELGNSGGVQVGVEMNALSVDHLECIEDAEINCLLNSNTFPVGLPSTSFFLNIPYAPGRKIIDAGLPLVLASDYNPGSTPSGKIPFLLSLACLKMKLLPEEAITAVTINGACAIELENTHGSISRGKTANLIITKPMRHLAFMPYAFGSDHVEQVIINGKIFHA
jgi:imidazolonepropionase